MRRVIGMDIHRTFGEMVIWEGGKLLRAGRVRTDTTVICANVAYPTDSGLLARAVGKLVRTARRVQAAGGETLDSGLAGARSMGSALAERTMNSDACIQDDGSEPAMRTGPSVASSPTKGTSAAT